MINPRFQPGGDKYEEIREDDRREFWEKVAIQQENLVDVLKSVVSTYTENELENGNTPMLERFIDEYSEWDHEELYATIAEEMERVASIVSRPSEAV